MVPWSEEVLLEEVRKRRQLWDYTSPNYFKKDLQAKLWKEISLVFEEEEINAAFCKETFARLRDNRAQRKRRAKKRFKSGAKGSAAPAENFQADEMAWLDEVGKDVSTWHESNLSNPRQNERPRPEGPVQRGGRNGSSPLHVPVISVSFAQERVRNCCEEVHAVNERLLEQQELRQPPATPRRDAPAATSSPVERPGALTSSPVERPNALRRNRRPPNRFSPPQPSPRRLRPRTNSVSSNGSNVSGGSGVSVASRNSGRGRGARRLRKQVSFTVERVAPDLPIIYEQSTLLSRVSSGAEGASQSPAQNREVRVQIHASADGPSTPLRRDQRPPLGRSPPARDLFSPHVRREVDEVHRHTAATPPSSTRRRQRVRRRSSMWNSPPIAAAPMTPPSAAPSPIVAAVPSPSPQQPARASAGRGGRNRGGPTRADVRRMNAEEQERRQREVQMIHNNRRERLREVTRVQAEMARNRPGHAEAEQQPNNVDPAEDRAEIALMKQYLSEKELDYFGTLGQTLAGMLRKMPVAVSGKAMVVMMGFVNKLQNCTDAEQQEFLSAPLDLW